MELLLRRHWLYPKKTIGRLYVGTYAPTWSAYTLEDKVRPVGDKIKGETAIPEGRYRVVWTMSNRFKKMMPELLDVKNFEGVRIHSGNKEEDTDGCILIGSEVDKITNTLIGSRIATERIYGLIEAAIKAGDEVWLTIENRPYIEYQ